MGDWSGVTLDEHTWSRGLLSDESYTLDHGAFADVLTVCLPSLLMLVQTMDDS